MIRPKKVYDISLDISEYFMVYEKVDYRRSRLTDAQDGIVEQPTTNAGSVRATRCHNNSCDTSAWSLAQCQIFPSRRSRSEPFSDPIHLHRPLLLSFFEPENLILCRLGYSRIVSHCIPTQPRNCLLGIHP